MLKTVESGKYYISNEELAKLFNSSIEEVENAFSELASLNLIQKKHIKFINLLGESNAIT